MKPTARAQLHLEVLEDRTLLAADSVLDWNLVLQQALRKSEMVAPTLAARNAAIVHGAIYDAFNAVMRIGEAYLKTLKTPPANLDPDAAIAGAAWWSLKKLFPEQKQIVNEALVVALAGIPNGQAETLGVGYGKYVAKQYLKLRKPDADLLWQGGYQPGNRPGMWQPTNQLLKAITPKWGRVNPFTLMAADHFVPPPLPSLTSSDYALAFTQVKGIGSASSLTRTLDQTQSAIFWAYDTEGKGTPVTLYNQVLFTVANQQGNHVGENARLFALANFAMADAAIAAWKIKFEVNSWRPITAIRQGANDGNPTTAGDPNWTPLAHTVFGDYTASPSYVSAHAAMGAAAFGVLRNFYGTDHVSFTLTSDELPGVTRSYLSFSQAARENSLSRVYLGMNFIFDVNAGESLGSAIATFVTTNYLRTTRQP